MLSGFSVALFHARPAQQRGLSHRAQAARRGQLPARPAERSCSREQQPEQNPLTAPPVYTHPWVYSIRFAVQETFPIFFVPGPLIWCSIVMSVTKIFPCCHSTFPVIGCFKNCYKICSH